MTRKTDLVIFMTEVCVKINLDIIHFYFRFDKTTLGFRFIQETDTYRWNR